MKRNILIQHGIEVKELDNGIILASNEDGTYTNITNWSISKLYIWLGY